MYNQQIQLEELIKELRQVKQQIALQSILQKEILDLNEASIYLNLSDSTIYKLTSRNELIHFKPNGKKIYFRRADLDSWVLSKSKQLDGEEVATARENVRELLRTIK